MTTKNSNVYEGALYIDTDKGVITFLSKEGQRILRVTHLPTPIPDNVMIDMVSLPNLKSYTPLQHTESFQEWIDDGIEPARELGPE
jgi:hypothetical protein